MEYETFSDYLDALHEKFEEALEEAQKYSKMDDFKMHIFFEMKKFIVDLPKVCTEIAVKELTRL